MRKTKRKSLSAIKRAAWKLFSEYVRRKYADDSTGIARCYTSGVAAHWTELQCGHAIGGRHNAVLFDEEICRPQTVAENVFKRGNYPVFVTKLIEENGLDWWQKKLAASREVIKYSRSDLEDLIANLKTKLESLNG